MGRWRARGANARPSSTKQNRAETLEDGSRSRRRPAAAPGGNGAQPPAGTSGRDHYVWARAAWGAIDTAANAGLSIEPLFDGLPFDARSIRQLRHIAWSDYAHLCESIELGAGGPDALVELISSGYHAVVPEVQAMLSGIVSPKHLVRALCEVLAPLMLPPLSAVATDLGEDQIRFDLRLAPGARPCRAWFVGTIGVLRGAPCHLGLPPADIVATIGGTESSYVVDLPPSRTLPSRLARVPGKVQRRVASWFTLGRDEAGSSIDIAFGVDRSREVDPSDAWALSARQREVLALLVKGKSNKEIAASLGCAENTVEFHITTMLRKSGTTSRGELIALVLGGV